MVARHFRYLLAVISLTWWVGSRPLLAAEPLIIKPSVNSPIDNDRDDLLAQEPPSAPRSPAAVQDDPPRHRLALGVNYVGGQIRYHFSKRWALEGRFQSGKSSSDYGDVTAKVFGARLYRYFHTERRFMLYATGEAAKADAKSEQGGYTVSGFAFGGAAGFEYKLTKRLALAIDMGPYVISLNERTTQTSQTNLDFILNTALVVYLF